MNANVANRQKVYQNHFLCVRSLGGDEIPAKLMIVERDVVPEPEPELQPQLPFPEPEQKN